MSKSAIYTANTAVQTVPVNGIINLGAVVRRFGCNLSLTASGIQTEGTGYYRVSANINVTPSVAGTVAVQILKDGIAVTGAVASATAVADQAIVLPIDALIREKCPCNPTSFLTLQLTGTASDVGNVAMVVEKE